MIEHILIEKNLVENVNILHFDYQKNSESRPWTICSSFPTSFTLPAPEENWFSNENEIRQIKPERKYNEIVYYT